MHKFKTLIIKDLWIYKKSLLIPFWITAGFYILIILSFGVAYFKGDLNFNMLDIQEASPLSAVNYIVNFAIVWFPGLMSLIFTVMLTQGALNEDVRKNCELFHRSQPVSVWYRTGSKYLTGIVGNWVVLLIIALFNFIVINIILALFHQCVFSTAFAGLVQSYISFIKTGLIIGSITFFLSVVFKDKAFLQGFAVLLAVQILFLILNTLLNWKLPLPLSYLVKLLKTTSIEEFEVDASIEEISNFISRNWNAILFNWKTLVQLVFSGVLFAGATLIYKSKEIK
ncbi:MAG: hypothetical protein KAU01_11560 [Candidatus Cloacimonetes bacterium]|nr:hypothetical protein [Candidatus Cloacimonadota bacterium]